MPDLTVAEYARALRTDTRHLLLMLNDAGLPHIDGEAKVSDKQKEVFSGYLRECRASRLRNLRAKRNSSRKKHRSQPPHRVSKYRRISSRKPKRSSYKPDSIPDCPRCGSTETKEIVYGLLSNPGALEAWEIPGGCAVDLRYRWSCSSCRFAWQETDHYIQNVKYIKKEILKIERMRGDHILFEEAPELLVIADHLIDFYQIYAPECTAACDKARKEIKVRGGYARRDIWLFYRSSKALNSYASKIV